jgi:mono/diheme cytochrome c family protein
MRNFLQVLLVTAIFGINLMNAGCGTVTDKPTVTNSTNKTSTAPSGVTATSYINKITLSWNPVADASSYNVYWSTNPGVTVATGAKETVAGKNYFDHVGLTVSRVYFYVVTAVTASGEGDPSAMASSVPGTDGENLYATHCQSCHGLVTAFKTKADGTSENIKAAIASNKGGMGVLSTLTDSQIDILSQQLPCH